MPRHTTTLLVAAIITLTISACSPAQRPTPSTEPIATPSSMSPTPVQTPTPTPTPTRIPSFEPAPTAEAADVGAVRSAWQTYMNVLDRHYKAPELTDFSDLTAITTGTEGARAMNSVTRMRENNAKRVGDAIYRDIKITPPAPNADGVTISVVAYCFDPSQIKANYEQAPKDTLDSRVTMELLPDGTWRAAESKSEKKPC